MGYYTHAEAQGIKDQSQGEIMADALALLCAQEEERQAEYAEQEVSFFLASGYCSEEDWEIVKALRPCYGCKYYSFSSALSCAVNPHSVDRGCREFVAK